MVSFEDGQRLLALRNEEHVHALLGLSVLSYSGPQGPVSTVAVSSEGQVQTSSQLLHPWEARDIPHVTPKHTPLFRCVID